MATAVYDVVTIELQDGTEVNLRPLPIKQLRVFMKKLEMLGKIPETKEGEEPDVTDDFMDQIVELAKICLAKNKDAKDVEDFDDVLDLPSTYKIIEVCTGVDLQDPKLMTPMQ